jgi:predicted transcriptional regulator
MRCATLKGDEAMSDIKLIVGGSLEDDAAAFVDAWRRTERGEEVRERTLAFESWEALAKVLTGERYRLLKHVHAHPEPSVSALARSLGRQYRRVHADVAALEAAGLLVRSGNGLHATADTLKADIRL